MFVCVRVRAAEVKHPNKHTAASDIISPALMD